MASEVLGFLVFGIRAWGVFGVWEVLGFGGFALGAFLRVVWCFWGEIYGVS